MGQHRQALDIYVFKMKDPGKAEEYERKPVPKDIANVRPDIAINSSWLKLLLRPRQSVASVH